MKKYNFLWKPIFYIFSILFAAWLVNEIEKISPSNFGMQKSPKIFDAGNSDHQSRKQYLKSLFVNYRAGQLDSAKLDEKLTLFLNTVENSSNKNSP
ncbi:MAG: hypothetical protein A3F72_07030 [Bacteroidetes bacterium RIFCSPLOWO2_12_FULL_35_15]|nr:MAG: hypothetical protein A3F72_07030 [Bacteroidetes bacterium RIFCSPLOWO2_12_FULL_35_15]